MAKTINKEILVRLEEVFTKKLNVKTNWGRLQIMQTYRESVTETLLEMLEGKNVKNPALDFLDEEFR